MNREEMLTKLAMEMDSWPTIQAERVGLQFRYDLCDRLVVPLDRAWDEVITERDWLQRRAELINKPSWDDAPDWAKWLAQDADGEWYWHENKPEHDHSGWVMEYETNEAQEFSSEGNIPAGHDWRDTLEERPDLSSLEGVTTTLGAALGFDEERADILGQNGNDGDHYMTPEEEELTAEEKHTCHRCGGSWWSPMNSECPCRANRSDGSTAKYYELPIGALELQDLISYRNMNGQDAEIFRAIYRKGLASHSDALRDARKVLFYAQAEVERIERYGA